MAGQVSGWNVRVRKLKSGQGSVCMLQICKVPHQFQFCLGEYADRLIGSQAIDQAAIFRGCSPRRLCTHKKNGAVSIKWTVNRLACPASLYPICVGSEACQTGGRLTGQSSWHSYQDLGTKSGQPSLVGFWAPITWFLFRKYHHYSLRMLQVCNIIMTTPCNNSIYGLTSKNLPKCCDDRRISEQIKYRQLLPIDQYCENSDRTTRCWGVNFIYHSETPVSTKITNRYT